jgi:MFS family permease
VEVDGTSDGRNGEPAAASPEDEESQGSVTELLEQLAPQLAALGLYEARLAASRHEPELRRAAGGIVATGGAVVALVVAFVFANAAVALLLSTVVPSWVAAVVLAVVWAVVGGVLGLVLLARARRAAFWRLEEAQRAREEAEQAVRDTLERLAPAISREIALAAMPAAGDMAGSVLDAGDELLDNADDMMESIVEDVPGGGVVNQMWDVVLMPGRFGVRVATTVLKREPSSN